MIQLKRHCYLVFALILIGIALGNAQGKIAVLLPQSGPHAKYGNLQYQGYKLAEVEIGQKGSGAKIRYFDIGGKENHLETFINNDVLKWKPDLLIGPYDSSTALRLVQILSTSSLPLIIPTATEDSLSQTPDSNIFRIAPPAGAMAIMVAEFFAHNKNRWQLQQSIIVAEESSFARGVIRVFEAASAIKDLPPPKAIVYKPGQLTSVLDDISNLQKSLVISITRSSQDGVTITKLLQENVKLLGFLSGYLTPEFRREMENKKMELFIVSPWQNDSNTPAVNDFIAKFARKYQDAFSKAYPQYHNAQAFSALVVANEALAIAQNKKTSLHATLNLMRTSTPLGNIRFVDFGGYYQQMPASAVVQKFENGQLLTIYPYDKSKKLPISPKKSAEKEKISSIELLLGNQIIALFVILVLGLLLGKITIFKISLGSSGVIFVALLFGHFHFTIPSGIGTLGLVLFIYCVGISAGPAFFRALIKKGATLAKMSLVVVGTAALTIFICAQLLDIPIALATGIFAGALTSTPALAAAMDNLKDSSSLVSVGYGIAYPFGVVGVVFFVQLLPRFLKRELDQATRRVARKIDKIPIIREWIKVENPAIEGKLVTETKFLEPFSCQISRVLENGQPISITTETRFHQGQLLLLVGEASCLEKVTDYLGRKHEKPVNIELGQSKKLVVTANAVVGRRLREIASIRKFGTIVTRIQRSDLEFVPSMDSTLEYSDQITVVGHKEDIENFAKFVGHRTKALDETDLFSLIVGILTGVLIGMISFNLPGDSGFSLGFSGGPLLVALILGHFGRIGKISGRIPSAAQNVLREIGLIFFLAQAGVKAGAAFVSTLQEYGIMLFLVGGMITIFPLLLGFLWGKCIIKLPLLEIIGGLCGGMTSTPALGTITAKTDSEVPVVSYATAYPVSLILMIVFVQLIIGLSSFFTPI